jgi:hypothetical protein
MKIIKKMKDANKDMMIFGEITLIYITHGRY